MSMDFRKALNDFYRDDVLLRILFYFGQCKTNDIKIVICYKWMKTWWLI